MKTKVIKGTVGHGEEKVIPTKTIPRPERRTKGKQPNTSQGAPAQGR